MVAGITLRVTGVGGGNEYIRAAFLIFDEDSALIMSDLLQKRKVGFTHKLSSMDKDVLKETSNIIVGSYLTAASNTLQIEMVQGLPDFNFDMFGKIIDQVLAAHKITEETLIAEILFSFYPTVVTGHLLLFFPRENIIHILAAEKTDRTTVPKILNSH